MEWTKKEASKNVTSGAMEKKELTKNSGATLETDGNPRSTQLSLESSIATNHNYEQSAPVSFANKNNELRFSLRFPTDLKHSGTIYDCNDLYSKL